MKAFTTVSGVVAPMDRANVDTDMIIPKQFLKSIKRSAFGKNLFDELRYLDEGLPDQECTHRPINPEFPLNQNVIRAPVSCWRAKTSAVVQAESTPHGRCWISVYAPWLPQASPTSSSITASRTAFCPSSCRKSRWMY